MLKGFLDKVFTFPAIVILNTAIVALVEFTGKFFIDTGAIHAIAIIFIITSFAALFIRYYIADPISQKFLRAAEIALVIFSASHVVEFFSYKVFKIEEDATFINVANFYALSTLCLIIGVEFIARSYQKKSALINWLTAIGLGAFSAMIGIILRNDKFISLEPSSPTPYIYGIIMLGLYAMGLYRISKAKAITPLRSFVNFMNVGMLLILFAALPNIFYELLEEDLHIPTHQIIYFAHFTFFVALSYMSVAFTKLATASGLYKETLEIIEKENKSKTKN